MKNREKYRGEILKSIKDTSIGYSVTCEFIRKAMFPTLGVNSTKEEHCGNSTNEEYCDTLGCNDCSVAFAFWLDEEYIEPPKPEVDWSKVPGDTLVRVRNSEYEEWKLKYFKRFKENVEFSYVVWASGTTSKTARGFTENWRCCELVEDENDCN